MLSVIRFFLTSLRGLSYRDSHYFNADFNANEINPIRKEQNSFRCYIIGSCNAYWIFQDNVLIRTWCASFLKNNRDNEMRNTEGGT